MRRIKIESLVDSRRIHLDESMGPDGVRRHDYALDGGPCPGVNQVLEDEGLKGPGSEFSHDEEAARRGQAVHKAVYLELAAGTLDPSTVHPIVRPYLDQAIGWADRNEIRVLAAELLVGYPAPAWCGKLDLVVQMRNVPIPAVIDLKTTSPGGTVPGWARYQVRMYSLCIKEPTRCGMLHLDGSGKDVDVVWYEDRRDAGVVLAAATLWHTKRALYGAPRRMR